MRSSQKTIDMGCIDLTRMTEDEERIMGEFIEQETAKERTLHLAKNKNYQHLSRKRKCTYSFTLLQDVMSHRLVNDKKKVGHKVIGDKILGRGTFGVVKVVLGSLYFDEESAVFFKENHSLAMKEIRQNPKNTRDYFSQHVMREVTLSRQAGENYLHFKSPTFFECQRNEKNVAGERLCVAYIIMKRIHGKTLQDYIDAKELTAAQMVEISFILTELLQKDCHQQFVQHRDIKPSNIIVEINDNGKIVGARFIDFNLAKDLRKEDFENGGTVYYIAPEQLLGDGSDQRADFYQFAKTLAMLLGLAIQLRNDRNTRKIVRDIMSYDTTIFPTKAFRALSGISIADGNIIVKMLLRMTRLSPDARPESLAELSACFKKIAITLGLSPERTLAELNRPLKDRQTFFAENPLKTLMLSDEKEENEAQQSPFRLGME